jgi:hypothetical protein
MAPVNSIDRICRDFTRQLVDNTYSDYEALKYFLDEVWADKYTKANSNLYWLEEA